MSLPSELEVYSYECTRGDTCAFHQRDKKTGTVLNHGKYVFRWLLKNERAIDRSLNVVGWHLVNRSAFSDVPRMMFSVSGGVELGDSILSYMSVMQALEIRKAPGDKSRELLKSRMTPSKKKPGRMIMTGNPDAENVYEPDMGKEASDSGSGSSSDAGALVEGRDF